MPAISVNGTPVNVDDSFMSLTPEQQNATVDEIAKSLGGRSMSEVAANPPRVSDGSNSLDLRALAAAKRANIGSDIAAVPRAVSTAIPFEDRAEAGVKALAGQGDYGSNLEDVRKAQDAVDPYTKAAAVPLAAMLTGGATMAATAPFRAAPAVQAAVPLATRIMKGAGIGGAYGGVSGLSSAPDLTDIPDDIKRTAVGTGIGVGIGTALPVVGAGVNKIFKPAQQVAEETAAQYANVSPAVAQKARALIEDSHKMGMPLTLDEAIAQANGGETGLSRVAKVVANSKGGQGTMDAFYNQRPQQIQDVGNAQIKGVAPNPNFSSRAGLDVQEGANDIIKKENQTINRIEDPYYKRAESVVIPPEAFNDLSPKASAGLRWASNQVMSDPVASAPFRARLSEQPTIDEVGAAVREFGGGQLVPAQFLDRIIAQGQQPNTNTVAFLDAVRSKLSAKVNLQPNASSEEIEAARHYRPALEELDKILNAHSSDYETAKDLGRALREQYLNPLKNSVVGQVAETPNLRAQAGAVFPSSPTYDAANDVSRLAQNVVARNPQAAESLVRDHLQSTFNEATQNLQGGANQYGAANFAKNIAGNTDQAKSLQAFIQQLPNGEARWNGFRRFLDIAEATGKKPQTRSDTAFNQQIQKNLQGNNPINIVKDTVKSGLSTVTQLPARLSQWYQEASTGANIQQLAKILTDPRSGKILERLGGMSPDNKTAQMLAYRLTYLGAATATAPKRRQDQ